MDERSKRLIEHWTQIKKESVRFKDRLMRYVGSRILDRDFGESVEDYLSRSGLVEFVDWAKKEING
jgi:hypothetical protein